MAKKLSVYYAKVPNMGDVLNKDIIEKCFGYEVEHKSYLTGKLRLLTFMWVGGYLPGLAVSASGLST